MNTLKAATLLTGFALAGTACAADRDWSIALGAGIAVAPEYEGAEDHRVGIAPIVNLRWRRFMFDGTLRYALVERENTALFVGIGYDSGRRERDTSGPRGTGSEFLRGLGTIDGAATVEVAGSHQVGPVTLLARVTRWTDAREFMTADAGVEVGVPVGASMVVGASLGATWANDAYMQAWFGVTPQQSANSRFPAYAAEGGIKNYSATLFAAYRIADRWTAQAVAGASRLQGDAAASGIVQEATGVTALVAITYTF